MLIQRKQTRHRAIRLDFAAELAIHKLIRTANEVIFVSFILQVLISAMFPS